MFIGSQSKQLQFKSRHKAFSRPVAKVSYFVTNFSFDKSDSRPKSRLKQPRIPRPVRHMMTACRIDLNVRDVWKSDHLLIDWSGITALFIVLVLALHAFRLSSLIP